ncbi:MAG: hypothetical protein IJW71_00735, partial [Clostridia bacterium]|nr:hypothetical protein [Clostridia bacterium]
ITKPDEKKEERLLEYKERKRIEAQKRKTLNRYNKVEELIEANEQKIGELERLYNDPEIASDYTKLGEISSEIDTLHKEIDDLMKEWEALQMKIDEGI